MRMQNFGEISAAIFHSSLFHCNINAHTRCRMENTQLKSFKLSVIFFLGLLTFSCATQLAGIGRQPVDRTSENRSLLKLFSFKLPPGDNWYVSENKADRYILIKDLDSNKKNFTVSARVYSIKQRFASAEDFLRYMKTIRPRNAAFSKFSLRKHTEQLQNRFHAICTQFIIKGAEKSEHIKPWFRKQYEARGYSCLHPQHPDKLITLQYTAITQQAFIGREALAEGQQFIDSLKFSQGPAMPKKQK